MLTLLARRAVVGGRRAVTRREDTRGERCASHSGRKTRARAAAALAGSLALASCSSSGVVAPKVVVELTNDATDARLYGDDGEIAVLLEASVAAGIVLDPGERVATLTPAAGVAFVTDLGHHEVSLHDADAAGRTTLLSTVGFSVAVDGATVRLRVTPDGGLCLYGHEEGGVRCEDR